MLRQQGLASSGGGGTTVWNVAWDNSTPVDASAGGGVNPATSADACGRAGQWPPGTTPTAGVVATSSPIGHMVGAKGKEV
jgi:hypothetical protein